MVSSESPGSFKLLGQRLKGKGGMDGVSMVGGRIARGEGGAIAAVRGAAVRPGGGTIPSVSRADTVGPGSRAASIEQSAGLAKLVNRRSMAAVRAGPRDAMAAWRPALGRAPGGGASVAATRGSATAAGAGTAESAAGIRTAAPTGARCE